MAANIGVVRLRRRVLVAMGYRRGELVAARKAAGFFTQRAEGRSMASLARELNERGIPCPAGADPARNSHRTGARWIVRTVATILENPRYTGRQVWNRQHTKGRTTGTGGRRGGRGAGTAGWNPIEEWEISEQPAHPALVDEDTFLAVQHLRAARPTDNGDHRTYHLAGLVICGLCERRMDAHWVHGRAGYRCRHGHTTAAPRPTTAPRNLYVREDHLLATLPHLLEHPHTPDATTAPYVLAEELRSRLLEIVCTTDDIELQRQPGETPTEAATDSSMNHACSRTRSPRAGSSTAGERGGASRHRPGRSTARITR